MLGALPGLSWSRLSVSRLCSAVPGAWQRPPLLPARVHGWQDVCLFLRREIPRGSHFAKITPQRRACTWPPDLCPLPLPPVPAAPRRGRWGRAPSFTDTPCCLCPFSSIHSIPRHDDKGGAVSFDSGSAGDLGHRRLPRGWGAVRTENRRGDSSGDQAEGGKMQGVYHGRLGRGFQEAVVVLARLQGTAGPRGPSLLWV